MKLDQILREHGEVAPLPKKKPLPRTRQAEARSLLTKIPYAATREEAERQKQAFQAWCAKRGLAEVGRRVTDKTDKTPGAVWSGRRRGYYRIVMRSCCGLRPSWGPPMRIPTTRKSPGATGCPSWPR